MENFKELMSEQIKPAIKGYVDQHGRNAPNPIVGIWVYCTQYMIRHGADVEVLHDKLDHHAGRVKMKRH